MARFGRGSEPLAGACGAFGRRGTVGGHEGLTEATANIDETMEDWMKKSQHEKRSLKVISSLHKIRESGYFGHGNGGRVLRIPAAHRVIQPIRHSAASAQFALPLSRTPGGTAMTPVRASKPPPSWLGPVSFRQDETQPILECLLFPRISLFLPPRSLLARSPFFLFTSRDARSTLPSPRLSFWVHS